uniref:BTB domain-containing protein n=1 Tax=Globodera rostochiensis TaxID=31243 RepID=A0A914HQZ7_GLORO
MPKRPENFRILNKIETEITNFSQHSNCLLQSYNVQLLFLLMLLQPSYSTEVEQRRSIATFHDDLTVHIGDRQVTVSASWLMVVSPVIKRMLSVEMKEKQQRALNLDGHDITMEQFMQFLDTVNDHLQHGQTRPNPDDVADIKRRLSFNARTSIDGVATSFDLVTPK